MYDYDLVVIGAGSGGVRAGRLAAGRGRRVAVVEGRHLGGTCVNVGCVPKKLMVYAAHFSDDFRDATGFGWTVPTAAFEWGELIAAKDKEIGRLNGIYRRLLHGAGAEIVDGWAVVTGPHEVEVRCADGTTRALGTERILVAVGGAPVRPDIPGGELALVSDDVFTLPTRPKRLVVVGGGYIAVEFACIFAGLGSQVDLAYRGPHFLRGFDDDLRHFVADEMRKKGVRLHFNARVECIESEGTDRVCTLNGGDTLLVADAVLYAIGRRPATAGLGLEAHGVDLDAQGAIKVHTHFQSSVPSIFALGDVTDRLNLTPVALAEAIAFVRTWFDAHPTSMNYENIPTAVFTQPPLATVGLTESQARSAHDDVEVYTSEFRPLKHTLSGSDERTFMKLVIDRATDRVLGVHMCGADAPEIVQGLAVALQCGATKAQFDATIGIHPTAAEEFVTMREPRSRD